LEEANKSKVAKHANAFIGKAQSVHGDKYDYSLVEYKGSQIPVSIICKKHNHTFSQLPATHIHGGAGCPICAKEICDQTSKKKAIEAGKTFVTRAIKVHGTKYDYSKTVYELSDKYVEIVCPKHGSFWQIPDNHLAGYGCNQCTESVGENKVAQYLMKSHVKYQSEKWFPDCRNINPLPFDFYLPEYHACIEVNGKQHYEAQEFFGGQKALEGVQHRDQIKLTYCQTNNIPLLIIPYTEVENIPQLIETFLKGLTKK
jgi:hypothetical protein